MAKRAKAGEDPNDLHVSCSAGEHGGRPQAQATVDDSVLDRASRIFRALGEPARLRLAYRLAAGPACVSELADLEGEAITTISQRLRVLRADNIVRRRRDGKHMLYFLSDEHMLDLVSSSVAHVSEPHSQSSEPDATSPQERSYTMALDHPTHGNHTHTHSPECEHTAIQHDGHVDYLHNGHLHHAHEGHVDEHVLEVSKSNPDACTDGHGCSGHDAAHTHGADCGHEAVPHGDHVDYLVEGHLHHPHNGHCDNHGDVQVVQ